MKQSYLDYLKEKQMEPEIMATIWMVVQLGEGLPMHHIGHEFYPTMEDAQEYGYISITDAHGVRLTQQARDFLDTLLVLAREEGDL